MVAPNETINFTKALLAALPLPPVGKRHSFKDARVKGLIIRVTANGQKTFQLYQKHQGRPVRVTLGTFPDMTIENARKEATKAKGALAGGTTSTPCIGADDTMQRTDSNLLLQRLPLFWCGADP